MSTTMVKKEEVTRKWYILDAAGKPLGKTAVIAADLLHGKRKVDYTPHVDTGDYVIVINAEKAVLTGKKLDQKFYYRHSGRVGNLHAVKYKDLMAQKPELAVKLAVKGMLPKNKLGDAMLGRLKVFKGDVHNPAAQKPEVYTAE